MEDSKISNLKWHIKVESIFGMASLIVVFVLIIALVIISIINGPLPGLGIPHAIVMLSLGIWYGIRCLMKANDLKDELNRIK